MANAFNGHRWSSGLIGIDGPCGLIGVLGQKRVGKIRGWGWEPTIQMARTGGTLHIQTPRTGRILCGSNRGSKRGRRRRLLTLTFISIAATCAAVTALIFSGGRIGTRHRNIEAQRARVCSRPP